MSDLIVAILMAVQLGVGFALGLFWSDLRSDAVTRTTPPNPRNAEQVVSDRGYEAKRLHDDVWCTTCQHAHIPMIPVVTYACHDCGFGAWGDTVAAAHASGWPDHIVYGNHHQTVPLANPAGLMETQHITPTCRANRTNEGAWDEAVRRLREIYDAQVGHNPDVTLALDIRRETP